MSFMDNLKKKAEELDLETKARQLQETATQAAKQAREKAGTSPSRTARRSTATSRRPRPKIDEKTEGKYADKVAKVKEQVGRGVDKVAEGHTSGPTPVHESGFDAASGDVPVPTREALADTTLEDTVLGLDHLPTAPAGHQDAPTPEDADAGPRGTQPPHDGRTDTVPASRHTPSTWGGHVREVSVRYVAEVGRMGKDDRT